MIMDSIDNQRNHGFRDLFEKNLKNDRCRLRKRVFVGKEKDDDERFE